MVEHTVGELGREVSANVADMPVIEGRIGAHVRNQALYLLIETNAQHRTDACIVFGGGRVFLLGFTVEAVRFHSPTILRMRALTTSPGTSTEGSRSASARRA